MLISNKFVFIHIPKVAGSSIQKALAPHVSRPTRKHRDKQYSDHITLKQLKKRANVSHKFTFAFVRNPWGWAQSLYHYVIQYGDGRGWQGNIPSYTKKGMSAWIVKDMERWIKKRTNWHTSNKIFQQSDWISPKVDFIEDMSISLKILMKSVENSALNAPYHTSSKATIHTIQCSIPKRQYKL